jgi:DNA-binding beta-propeller fold protein YncE
MFSGFDYVTGDARRHRIYAAHTGSNALLIVNADTGAMTQVRVGPMHGVAVNPDNGHVYTGDGMARTVSEVDPQSAKVLAAADVDGTVDAIAYDPALHRIYADEDDGTHVYVVDTNSMKEVASLTVPGHKPEYLQVDPQTHEVYQNIADLSEIAVIDPTKLQVTRTIPTPVITNNHPLQYDAAYHLLIVGGANGTLATYSRAGKLLSTAAAPQAVDQCDLNPVNHYVACAGSKKLVVLAVGADGSLKQVADFDAPAGVHTVAWDRNTGAIWIVWHEPGGDFIQSLKLAN